VHAVLFDWDGTLVDTLPFMFAATELVMAEYGAPITWADYRRHFSPDWRLLYRRFGLPERDIESVGVRWWSLYRGRDEAMLLPGAAEALRRLAAAGFALGVVTAGRRDSVEPQLARHGLAELLPVRVYGDDAFEPKPGPGGLRHAIGALGLAGQPGEIAYVGDALDDMRMALAARARGVGIRSDLATDGELRAAGASEVADSVAAWVDVLLG
jgi:HAD superfamily hydrolase (TIGR01549 family)